MAYIKVEDAIKHIEEHFPCRPTADFMEGQQDCIEQLKSLPTADVEEVRHAKWIYEVKYYTCSNCAGKRFNLLLGTDAEFCPYCGAKMDGGKEEC